MCIIKTEKLTKIYGGKDSSVTKAVNNIDLSVDSGEFTAIMGPSGSGKSTLLNLLSMIDEATSGSIEFGGSDISLLKDSDISQLRRSKMGFVFQDFNLMDSLNVKENILLPMIMEDKPIDYMENKSQELMNLTGISHLAQKHPYNISGGEQQRTAIARALANEPDILFADEPTGNLDSKSSNDVMTFLKKINRENNNTILMVTHDVFAASFCKKIIFIKDGSIHSILQKKGSRKEFAQEILNFLSLSGGVCNEI